MDPNTMRVPIGYPKFSLVQQVLKLPFQKQQHAKNITVTIVFCFVSYSALYLVLTLNNKLSSRAVRK